MPFLIILIIIVLLGLYIISTQRQLVKIQELCQNALAQIGVQQTSRWDALTQLAKACKSYASYEAESLLKIIAERRMGGPAVSAEEVQAQDAAINSVLSRLIAVSESYPDLKASSIYRDTMSSINSYEDKVRSSRMIYNDTVTKLNRLVQQFPTNLIASMLGFQKKSYLEVEPQKTEMPDLDF
ncbi:MAG: LemA family protein [Eubacteriales bacterium]|nr:LemA family protein [Eubacteriales bacterium]